jgi:hypothetical protein
VAPELSVEAVEAVAVGGASAGSANASASSDADRQKEQLEQSQQSQHSLSLSKSHSQQSQSQSQSQLDKSQSQQLFYQYSVNGVPFAHTPESTEAMGDVVRLGTPLYPTVSLFSEETRVWCRFCEADVVYRSREAIGAPRGVRVYCLDGSLLLEETD